MSEACCSIEICRGTRKEERLESARGYGWGGRRVEWEKERESEGGRERERARERGREGEIF